MSMKPMFRYIMVLLTGALLTACNPKDPSIPGNQLDNYYFVKIGDAALPVRVTGNLNSDVAVIFIHGGPGGSAQSERQLTYWNRIEQNYKVVYYDQRGGGIAQGNAKPEEMTLEQFAKDLDVIVEFTRQVARANTIFLHGVSWGGGLGTYYATDTAHQRKINGLIAECPAYNLVGGMALSRQWILAYADSMIAANSSVKYWQNVEKYYAQHPVITSDIFDQHLKYLNQAKGVVYNVTGLDQQNISIPRGELDAVFKNQLYTIANLSYQGGSVFERMDLTPLLPKIDIPVLLVWGEKDGLLPKYDLAAEFASGVGAPYITYFPGEFQEAAHLPHGEDAAQMQSDVIAFIEAHR